MVSAYFPFTFQLVISGYRPALSRYKRSESLPPIFQNTSGYLRIASAPIPQTIGA